jgi:hypothetical protein
MGTPVDVPVPRNSISRVVGFISFPELAQQAIYKIQIRAPVIIPVLLQAALVRTFSNVLGGS